MFKVGNSPDDIHLGSLAKSKADVKEEFVSLLRVLGTGPFPLAF